MLALVIVGAAAWRTLASSPPAAQRPIRRSSPSARSPPSCRCPARRRRRGRPRYVAAAAARSTRATCRRRWRGWARPPPADPTNAEYRNAYAHALWRSGDRDGALAAHAEAARLDPRLQMQYARSLDVAGRPAEALAQYQQILDEEPLGLDGARGPRAPAVPQRRLQGRRRPPAERRSGRGPTTRCCSRSSPTRSTRPATAPRPPRPTARCWRRLPGAVVSRSLLAENLVEQGRQDEALAVLQEGLRAQPQAPLLQRQLGSVLERSGRPREAAAAYRAYAEQAPNAPDAKELLARAARLEAAGGQAMSARRIAAALLVAFFARVVFVAASARAQGLGDVAARERSKRAASRRRTRPRSSRTTT